MATRQHIVAMGGGGFSVEPDTGLLGDYVLQLVQPSRPRVCFVPTASGDSAHYIVQFYRHFPRHRCSPSHLELFGQPMSGVEEFLLDQDVIYVGGGNTVNLLAVWAVHGVDAALREAWSQGVVLCGVSAGAICWFEAGATDSYGQGIQPLRGGGLGILPGSYCPHYDIEPQRREAYQRLVSEGLPAGVAVEEDVALHYAGRELVEAVSSRRSKNAYRVELDGGTVKETPLQVRYLGTQ